MSNYYNFDDIVTELKKDIDKNESYLKAWENVEFCTKKDGTYFKNMKQNFKNAKYDQDYGVYQYELTVYTNPTYLNGYNHDSIRCYLNTHYDTNPIIKNKPENIKKVPYCYDVYVMDVDDIKQTVNDHIEYLKNHITDLKLQLENAEKIYTDFRNDFCEIMEKLDNACRFTDDTNKNNHCSLYYMVKNTVIDRYPYC